MPRPILHASSDITDFGFLQNCVITSDLLMEWIAKNIGHRLYILKYVCMQVYIHIFISIYFIFKDYVNADDNNIYNIIQYSKLYA